MSDSKDPWSDITPRTDRQARLAEAVVEEMLTRIISGAAPVGSVLPREADLVSMFGVSRTVIREAIQALEQRGITRSRRGSGTIVRPRRDWGLIDPDVLRISIRYDNGLDLHEEMVHLRVHLEGPMAGDAASRVSDHQRSELTDRLAQLDGLVSKPAEYFDADFKLHLDIMRLSGNRLAGDVIRTIHEQVHDVYKVLPTPRSEVDKTHLEHTAVVEAIAAGHRLDAQQAMADHIEDSWRRRRPRLLRAMRKRGSPLTGPVRR